MQSVKVPAGSVCQHQSCHRPAELGVTAPGRGVLVFCKRCARRLAKELDVPSLKAQLEQADKDVS